MDSCQQQRQPSSEVMYMVPMNLEMKNSSRWAEHGLAPEVSTV